MANKMTKTKKRLIMQCQGEKDYLEIDKDCDNCDDKVYCFTTRATPFAVSRPRFAFAETADEAKAYAARGRYFTASAQVQASVARVRKVGKQIHIDY